MTEPYKFSPEQVDELRACALMMVELDNLEKLSWDDAWSGIYPQKPTAEQVEAELMALMEKTKRLLSGRADYEEEHENLRERIRMSELLNLCSINIRLS